MCRLPLYQGLVSLYFKMYETLSPVLFYSDNKLSGLSAKDPISLYNSTWIWFFSMPWPPLEKINKTNIGHEDTYLSIVSYIMKEKVHHYNIATPACRLVSLGLERIDWGLFLWMAWTDVTWSVLIYQPGGIFMSKKTLSHSVLQSRDSVLWVLNRFLQTCKY